MCCILPECFLNLRFHLSAHAITVIKMFLTFTAKAFILKIRGISHGERPKQERQKKEVEIIVKKLRKSFFSHREFGRKELEQH